MHKTATGFCPTQNKEYSINVTYLDTSDSSGKSCIKGRFCCEYNKFNDKCNGNTCPIYASAK